MTADATGTFGRVQGEVDATQWEQFDRDGVVSLGQVISPELADRLAQRGDELATGMVSNPYVAMQLDTGGDYEAIPEAVANFEESTLLYRKVQGLEHDDLFRPVLHLPIVKEVCERMYNRHAGVSIFRAMLMNKPAGQGTYLPWHQDGGDVWGLDRDPLVTLWLALDDATPDSGCMEFIPGSHHLGLLSPRGSTLSDDLAQQSCPPGAQRFLAARKGEMLLLHNWTIHRSGVNTSTRPRRAFTTCLMDGRTISTSTGNRWPMLFGDALPEPYPFVRQLQVDTAFLRNAAARSEEYALSLVAEVDKLRAALATLADHS